MLAEVGVVCSLPEDAAAGVALASSQGEGSPSESVKEAACAAVALASFVCYSFRTALAQEGRALVSLCVGDRRRPL